MSAPTPFQCHAHPLRPNLHGRPFAVGATEVGRLPVVRQPHGGRLGHVDARTAGAVRRLLGQADTARSAHVVQRIGAPAADGRHLIVAVGGQTAAARLVDDAPPVVRCCCCCCCRRTNATPKWDSQQLQFEVIYTVGRVFSHCEPCWASHRQLTITMMTSRPAGDHHQHPTARPRNMFSVESSASARYADSIDSHSILGGGGYHIKCSCRAHGCVCAAEGAQQHTGMTDSRAAYQ